MKVFNNIVLFFNWVIIMLLVGAYLAAYISPIQAWYFAFLGLAFPIILLLNACFVVYWLFNLNWNILYSLVTIVIGFYTVQRFIQFGTVKKENEANTLNVIDFNTKSFGAYEGVKYDKELFFETLNSIKPDIMCFQEFVSMNTPIEKPMFERLIAEYKKFYKFNLQETENAITGFNISILSRFPIINSGYVERLNENGNCTIFSDILFKNDTIRIISTHLKSIAFDKNDFKTVAQINESNKNSNINYLDIRNIGSKLKNAFINRSKQAEVVRKFIDESKYKIILTGDFNDSPASYAYHIIKGNMKDAFIESGSGFSSTYVGKMPNFRIDYILADQDFEIFNYKPHIMNFSDHKMISATIKIK